MQTQTVPRPSLSKPVETVRLCECKALPEVGLNYPCVFNVTGPHIYGCGECKAVPCRCKSIRKTQADSGTICTICDKPIAQCRCRIDTGSTGFPGSHPWHPEPPCPVVPRSVAETLCGECGAVRYHRPECSIGKTECGYRFQSKHGVPAVCQKQKGHIGDCIGRRA